MKKLRATPLSLKSIKEILVADLPIRQIAARYGVSSQTISNIQIGVSHKDLFPEIERRPKRVNRSCYSCEHWTTYCTFGFPEVADGHGGFASQCAVYTAKPKLNESRLISTCSGSLGFRASISI